MKTLTTLRAYLPAQVAMKIVGDVQSFEAISRHEILKARAVGRPFDISNMRPRKPHAVSHAAIALDMDKV